MNRIALVCAAFLCFSWLISCKKSSSAKVTPVDTAVTYPDYLALAPGNYWVYEDFKLDSVNGAAYAQGTFDSVYVEKDTAINGNTYHKYWDVAFRYDSLTPEQPTVTLLRDSLSYTVNANGLIVFSSEDFTNIFRSFTFGPNAATNDTLLVTEQMGFKDSVINVPAGTFVTSSFRQVYHFPAYDARYGLTREYDYRYCRNIGKISYTTAFYSNIPNMFERRLVRYHVQ